MYIIQRGLVKLVTPGVDEPVRMLNDGMYFGESCILRSGYIRTVTAQAVILSHIYYLKRKEFFQVMVLSHLRQSSIVTDGKNLWETGTDL